MGTGVLRIAREFAISRFPAAGAKGTPSCRNHQFRRRGMAWKGSRTGQVDNLGIAHGSGEAILRGSSPSQKWFFIPELKLRPRNKRQAAGVKPSLKTGTSISGGDPRRRRSRPQQESPSGVAALNAPALGGPVDEALEVVAMPPAQSEEFSGIEVSGFLAQKCFQSPLDIRALPRRKAIAARGNPVIAERPKHPYTSIGPRVTSLEE